MKSFNDIQLKVSRLKTKPKLIVACPYDKNTLMALSMAQSKNIVDVIVVGSKSKIIHLLNEFNIDVMFTGFLEIESDDVAVEESYRMLMSGKADIIMKGLVSTNKYMSVLLSNKGFVKRKLLTHVAIYEVPSLSRLIFVSDPSIMIEPTVAQKKIIVDNSIDLLKYFEIERPKVAIISSTEVSNQKIRSSVDAIELMNLYSDVDNIDIYGPLGLDNAISEEASKIKEINSEVGGNADLLIMPNLDAGNILCKGLTYIGGIESAGIVMGANNPIILTSRSASENEKLNSITVASLIIKNNK